MFNNDIPVYDYILTKKLRSGAYTNPPPTAIVVKHQQSKDKNYRVLKSDRVPFLIIYGLPSDRLIDLVISPKDYYQRADRRINITYYITKQLIPTLQRIFGFFNISVLDWYNEINLKIPISYGPLKKGIADESEEDLFDGKISNKRKKKKLNVGKIDDFFKSRICLVCLSLCEGHYCIDCLQ